MTILAVAALLFLTLLIMPVGVKADPCFTPVYNASFSNTLSIYPSGSFTGSGTYGFSTYGFRGSCLSVNVSSGNRGYIYSVFNAKGSSKTSFLLKINNGTSFNFTRMILILADSSTYEVKLGFDNLKLVAYRGDRRNDGATFSTGKWYNLTIWLDASTDSLTILYNGSQTISIPTGVKLFLVKQVNFSLGVIDSAPSDVKTFFDEFSMLLSPIMFTDKPVYTSSSSVQVKITGDQFFTSSIDLTIIRPNGSALRTDRLTGLNATGGFSLTISLSNPSPGTYTMQVNRSGCVTKYHFGVWDVPRVWERKSTIIVKAGGLVRSGFATLYVRNSTGVVFSQRLESDSNGEINRQLTVPVNIQLGVLHTYLECDEAFDFKNMKVTTDTVAITLVKAVLNVTITTDATTYERVEPIDITVRVTYKDGSSLPWNGVVKLRLVHGGVEGREIFMDYTLGYWFKSIKTTPSDPLGSYLIKVEASDQYGNTGSGNKSISLTFARLKITLTSRLNETYERSVRLNVSVRVAYPDGTPLTSGSVALEMVKDQYRKGPFPLVSAGSGEWSLSKKIYAGEELGEWVLRITAVDESGNTGDLLREIRIVPARLSVKLLAPLGSVFSRTEGIPVSVVVKYPSQEVFTLGNGSVNAMLVHNGVEQALTQLKFSAGGWVGNISAPRNAPLGPYVLNVSALDSYGNYGFYTVPVEITKAVLSFEMEDLKDSYQAGFETVYLRTTVKYPDGSNLEDGNVTALVSSGTLTSIVRLRYQEGKWVGDYYLPVTNPVGEYRVTINATDPYGNTGVKEVYFRVSNLYLILVVISFAVVLAVSVSLLWIRRRRVQPPPIPEEYNVFA